MSRFNYMSDNYLSTVFAEQYLPMSHLLVIAVKKLAMLNISAPNIPRRIMMPACARIAFKLVRLFNPA